MTRRAVPLPAMIVLAGLALTACSSGPSGPDDPSERAGAPTTTSSVAPRPSPSTPTTPTTPSTPETEEPSPAVAEIRARRTVTTAGPEATYLGTVGPLVVVATPRGLAAHGSDGVVAWRFVAPRGYGDPEAWLLPDAGVAVVTRDVPTSQDVPFPGRTQARVVDATTGALLWRDDDVSFVSAGEGTVLTTGGCTGEQDDLVGDCTISAREPRTGAVRWAQPTYASAMVSAYRDGSVTVDSYATSGGDIRTRVFDLATGAPRSPFVRGRLTTVRAGFLDAGDSDRFAGDGCRQTVRRLDLDGSTVWRRVLAVGRAPDLDGRPCRSYFADEVADDLVALTTYDGREWLLDGATGATRWRGEPGEDPAAVADGLLITSATSNGYLTATNAVDLRTGERRWSFEVPDDVDGVPGRVEVTRTRVVVSPADCLDPCDTWVLDRRTGTLVATARGELVDAGPAGLVTSSGSPATLRFHRRPR